MGLLQFFAIYLHQEGLCSYKDFYSSFLNHVMSNPDTVVGKAFATIEKHLDEVLSETGTLSCADERFGKVLWTFEEYAYLCTVYELDRFYDEIADFLSGFGIDEDIFAELLSFQREMPKRPFDSRKEICMKYDFTNYFLNALDGKCVPLSKEDNSVCIEARPFDSWADFARIVAWYGKKDSNSTYIKVAKRSNS